VTARLEPATIDGLVYASSMVVLYAARHRLAVPALARWPAGSWFWASSPPWRPTWPTAGPAGRSAPRWRPGPRPAWSVATNCCCGSSGPPPTALRRAARRRVRQPGQPIAWRLGCGSCRRLTRMRRCTWAFRAVMSQLAIGQTMTSGPLGRRTGRADLAGPGRIRRTGHRARRGPAGPCRPNWMARARSASRLLPWRLTRPAWTWVGRCPSGSSRRGSARPRAAGPATAWPEARQSARPHTTSRRRLGTTAEAAETAAALSEAGANVP